MILFLNSLIVFLLTGCYLQAGAQREIFTKQRRIGALVVIFCISVGFGYGLLRRYGLNTYSLSLWFLIYILCLLCAHDLVEKLLPRNLMVMAIFVSGFLGIFNPNFSKLELLLSPFIAGGLLFCFNKLFKGGIGKGDTFVIVWMSLLVGIQASMSILLFAFIFAGIISLGLWIFKKANRSTRIPFVPFILLAAIFIYSV